MYQSSRMNLSQTRWDAKEGEQKEKLYEEGKAVAQNSDPVTLELAYKVPSLSTGEAGLVSDPHVISAAIPAFLISYYRAKANRTLPLGILYWCSDPKLIQRTTGPAVGMVEKSNNDTWIGFVLSMYVITGIDFTAAGEQCSFYCLSFDTPMWANCFSALSQRPPPFPCSSFMFVTHGCPPVLGHLLCADPANPTLHLTMEMEKQAKIRSFQLILGACELTLWFSSVVTYKHSHSQKNLG